jgi:hypothetical protein
MLVLLLELWVSNYQEVVAGLNVVGIVDINALGGYGLIGVGHVGI